MINIESSSQKTTQFWQKALLTLNAHIESVENLQIIDKIVEKSKNSAVS